MATATLEDVDVVIVPRFLPLVRWLNETIRQPELPEVEELHERVVRPMVAQIRIDIGDQVAELAAARLSLDDSAPSVKQQAEAMGVTRARVYQLLEDCARVMDVRWPEGRWLLGELDVPFRQLAAGGDRPVARHLRPVLPGRAASGADAPGHVAVRLRSGAMV